MKQIKIFLLFFLASFLVQAQDTCNPKICTPGFKDLDNYKIYAKEQQILNQLRSGGVKISGGTNFTITPSGTQSVVVTNSPTVTAIPTGTQAVSGTVTVVPSGTQSVAITGQPIVAALIGTSTVAISNSPTVTTIPSGTTTVVFGGGGVTPTVAVTGTPTVATTGTTTVVFGGGGVTPTVAVTGTVNTNVTNTVTTSENTVTTAVTYSYVTSSGTNTVTTGARMVSICNVGSANSNVNGTTLPSGSCFNLPPVLGILYPQITYDCLTSTIIALILR